MKILVVQDRLRSGGTERQSVLLANAFAAARHDTTLITFRPGGVLAPTVAADVRHVALQPFDLRLDWFAPALRHAVARAAPDVVLCMGRMANCYAGLLQRAVPGAAVIATLRTGKPLPWLFRRSLRRVRHVVANSREARDTVVARHDAPGDRITVVHNSIVFPAYDRETAAKARESLRARYGAAAETAVLLCVAMFRPEKNQRELIEIVAGLSRGDARQPAAAADGPFAADWQLWLAGDGPTRAACEQAAAARDMRGRVKFVGFHRDPSPLYAAADVAVHASWSESLSNFLIEAQAHGLPAVAYEAQGMRECFMPEHTGWTIVRDDRAAFRAALARLISEPAAARAARAAEARNFARTTFDPQRQVDAYLELFRRLR